MKTAQTALNCFRLESLLGACHFVGFAVPWLKIHDNIGIKHDFPFINIQKVPRELLKTEGEARGFQHLMTDLKNVNE